MQELNTNTVRLDTPALDIGVRTSWTNPTFVHILQEARQISLPRFALRVSILICLCVPHPLHGGEPVRTLQSFGVQMKGGQPAYPIPKNVAMGLFNPDPLLDVAYYSDGKVQVWQNQGNGLFEFAGTRPTAGEIESMEWKKEHMWSESIMDQFSWGTLHVRYVDGRNEVIHGHDIVPSAFGLRSSNQIPLAPPIDFREVWRSELQMQPNRYMALADIDNDGRTEIAYCFLPQFGDSNRFVVYECGQQ